MNDKATFPSSPEEGYFYIDADRLVARFPKVHADAETELLFQRTLRVPDDGKVYPLPVGLGLFPLRHLGDFEQHFPRPWGDRGGVVMPMRRGDAMWIAFDVRYPCAIKIGTGRINVLNGRRWTERLNAAQCDYVVAPPQPALDGFRSRENDVVRQFVVVPLGSGYSAEEQVAGKGKHGGIQVVIHPMKSARYALLRAQHAAAGGGGGQAPGWAKDIMSMVEAPEPTPLAIAAGGRMRERIAADPFGIDCWDQSARIRCFVTLVDADEWSTVTGIPLPMPPFTPADYEKEGLPWFEYSNDGLAASGRASAVADIRSMQDINAARGLPILEANTAIEPGRAHMLRPVRPPRRSRHPSPIVRTFWTIHNSLLSRRSPDRV